MVAAGAEDVPLIVGGTIPQRDVAKLEAAGAVAVFPTGTPLEQVVEMAARPGRRRAVRRLRARGGSDASTKPHRPVKRPGLGGRV